MPHRRRARVLTERCVDRCFCLVVSGVGGHPMLIERGRMPASRAVFVASPMRAACPSNRAHAIDG
jgi:hypothetical protein